MPRLHPAPTHPDYSCDNHSIPHPNDKRQVLV